MLISPVMVHMNHGEKQWSSVEDPARTIVAGGQHAALAAAFLQKICQNGSNSSRSYDAHEPLRTVCSKNEDMVALAHLVKFRGDSKGSGADEPCPTITSGAGSVRPAGAAHALGCVEVKVVPLTDEQAARPELQRAVQVHAFLIKYYGSSLNNNCPIDEPLHTVTSKARFGLVIVYIQNDPYVIVDICLRMLTPLELARAQGFGILRDDGTWDDSYHLTGTTANKVARIGNSVVPLMAQLLASANFATSAASVAAA